MLNFSSRTGIKVVVVVVVASLAAGGIVAERHLAASPSSVNPTKADSAPRVEVVRPRRVTVAQSLRIPVRRSRRYRRSREGGASARCDRRSRNGAGARRGQGAAQIQAKFARERGSPT